MASFQFCCGWPSLLLKPSGSHVRACRGSLWWSIRERNPSDLRCLHLIMSSIFGNGVVCLTFSFVTLSFQEIPWILRCHVQVFFSFVWLRLATALHCWAMCRGLVLHKALFSLTNWFSCSSNAFSSVILILKLFLVLDEACKKLRASLCRHYNCRVQILRVSLS